jgi:hypothetical protein
VRLGVVSSGADGAELMLLVLQQKREGIAVKMCVVRMMDGRFLYMHIFNVVVYLEHVRRANLV